MNQIIKLKNLNKKEKNHSHPLERLARRYAENILTPVSLSGVIVPWNETLLEFRISDYKLVTSSGVEYFIVADQEWREILAEYCWEDVKVKGLLNISNMSVIPQRVYPKGPTGERENVIDLASWRSRDLIKRLTKSMNDLVFTPATALAR